MKKQFINDAYIPALDGLRGVAVVLVVLYHTRIPPLSKGGFLGVDIFFCLSGFLITTLLIREFNSTGTVHFSNFYMRRMLRLAPALIIALVFFNLYSLVVLDATTVQTNQRSSLYTLLYISNIVKAFEIDDLSALGHTWSLSMEEQFYILFPTLFWMLLRLTRKQLTIFIMLSALGIFSWIWSVYLIASGSDWTRVHFAPETRVYEILTGCALAVLVNYWSRKAHWFHVGVRTGWIALGSLIALSCITSPEAPITYYLILPSVSLLTCIVILHLLTSKTSSLKRCLELSPLVLLGRISYGLYLYHQLIFVLFLHSENRRLFIGIPISIALSALSFYAIERPILGFKKRYRTLDTNVISNSEITTST